MTCIMSHEEFFGETSNHAGDLAPQTAQICQSATSCFPKTKITFEKKRFQTMDEIQENMTGPLMVNGRTV